MKQALFHQFLGSLSGMLAITFFGYGAALQRVGNDHLRVTLYLEPLLILSALLSFLLILTKGQTLLLWLVAALFFIPVMWDFRDLAVAFSLTATFATFMVSSSEFALLQLPQGPPFRALMLVAVILGVVWFMGVPLAAFILAGVCLIAFIIHSLRAPHIPHS